MARKASIDMKRNVSISIVLLPALLLIIGCGSSEPMGKVSGKVTFQGTPVSEGTVTFVNKEQGDLAAGELQPDGTYTLFSTAGGLKPGTYKVAIRPPEVEIPGDGSTAPSTGPKDVDNIPETYRNGETSGFEAVVEEGKNVFDFDMQ